MSKLISKDNFGMALHTALRKACDSPATSLLYNLIQMAPDDEWARWVEIIYAAASAAEASDRPCRRMPASQKAWEEDTQLDDYRRAVVRAVHGKVDAESDMHMSNVPVARCLAIAFRVLDWNDWEGFLAYVFLEDEV